MPASVTGYHSNTQQVMQSSATFIAQHRINEQNKLRRKDARCFLEQRSTCCLARWPVSCLLAFSGHGFAGNTSTPTQLARRIWVSVCVSLPWDFWFPTYLQYVRVFFSFPSWYSHHSVGLRPAPVLYSIWELGLCLAVSGNCGNCDLGAHWHLCWCLYQMLLAQWQRPYIFPRAPAVQTPRLTQATTDFSWLMVFQQQTAMGEDQRHCLFCCLIQHTVTPGRWASYNLYLPFSMKPSPMIAADMQCNHGICFVKNEQRNSATRRPEVTSASSFQCDPKRHTGSGHTSSRMLFLPNSERPADS